MLTNASSTVFTVTNASGLDVANLLQLNNGKTTTSGATTPPATTEMPSREAMLAFLAPKMARWALPDDMQTVADLPLTATGKVSKRLLRARFADYRLPPRSR